MGSLVSQRQIAIFSKVVRMGCLGKENFEKRYEKRKKESHSIIWVKRFPGRRNNRHKDPMQEHAAVFKGVKCGMSNDQEENQR